jgi:thymidine kinase
MRVQLFTPRLDNRYDEGEIVSRIGLARTAFAFTVDDDLYAIVRDDHANVPIHCVLVDEAQFLTAAQVLQLTLICDRLTIPVLAYGIRTDFRGEPFEGSKYLLAWAEELIEIKTVCPSGKKATMNARLDSDGHRVWEGEQIDIGHHYLSVSRAEFDLPRVSPVGYVPPEDLPVQSTPGKPLTTGS